MQSRLVALSDLRAADEAAWRDLARRAAEPNPFFEPDCLLAAWRHLPGTADIHLAVAEEAGRFFACIPINPVMRFGRLPVRTMQARAECTAVALASPLVDPARGVEAATALLAELHDRRRETRSGLLVLDWLGDDGESAAIMRRAASGLGMDCRRLAVWERPVMRRRDGPDEYWMAAVGTGRRRTIGQHRRRLACELGDLTLVDRGGDPAAPAEFLRLEASGWKSTAPGGEALANREHTAAFFTDLCARFAASGRLSLLSLEGGGRSAAMLCCLRAGDGLFAYRVGHDDSLRRHGPGIQLFVAAMSHLHRETDAAFLDSCTTPDNRYLSDLLPDTRRLSETVIVLGDRLDRAVVTAVPAIRQAKRALTGAAVSAARRRDSPDHAGHPASGWLDRAERCQFEQSPYRRARPVGRARAARVWARRALTAYEGGPVGFGAASRYHRGEWVRVKTAEEIRATLDGDDRCRGLYFTDAQWSFCGRTYRVETVVRRMLDDDDRMRTISRAVTLEHVTCDGLDGTTGCGRACALLWKDEWLEPSTWQEARTASTAGSYATVRCAGEVSATLDATGRIDGVAPTPQMLALAGQRFRVARRLELPRIRERPWKHQAGDDWFILEGVRCNGEILGAGGPCHRSCAVFWHRSWLHLDPDGAAGPAVAMITEAPAPSGEHQGKAS